jgi:hypothetical protein
VLKIGRLVLDDPESFPEPMGQSVAVVGGVPMPGPRSGLTFSAGLNSFPAGDSTEAQRERVRRQFRSILSNLPMRQRGLFLEWSEDPEQDGWYVPGSATSDVAGSGALTSAFWRFTGVELTLLGRPRTNRRAVDVELFDLRAGLNPRDLKGTLLNTNFSGMTPLLLSYLPAAVTDPVVTAYGPTSLSAARAGYDGAQVQALVGAQHLAVVSFEQTSANRNRGDVVVHDRRGVLTAPTTGPDAAWEEVYGPDWPWWAPTTDVPVLENSLCRVRYVSTNTDGFAIDRWDGAAWAEQGKVTIRRVGDSTGFCDTLVSARLHEWAPHRAVVAVVLKRAADTYSREEVFITLQRGWTGPRFEVYPAAIANGTKASAGVFYSTLSTAVGGTYAIKADSPALAILDTQAVGGATLGAANFTGENWAALIPNGAGTVVGMAVVQSAAAAIHGSFTEAYGSGRNTLGAWVPTANGYVSARFGFTSQPAGLALEAESMTLSAGTTSVADGAANGGNAAAGTRTAEADHVTSTALPVNPAGTYRLFVRVRNTSAGTLSVRGRYAGVDASRGVVTTTSTTFVWLDLGTVAVNGSATLAIRAWRGSAGTFHVDTVLAVPVNTRGGLTPLYDGPADLGAETLIDSRTPLRVVPR